MVMKTIKKFSDFWFKAHWITKIFMGIVILMLAFRLVTSCIKVDLIGLEIGCEDPATYIDEEVTDE